MIGVIKTIPPGTFDKVYKIILFFGFLIISYALYPLINNEELSNSNSDFFKIGITLIVLGIIVKHLTKRGPLERELDNIIKKQNKMVKKL